MTPMTLSRITPWTVLKWTAAICIAVVAVFPIWWMFNVVFADPGVPVSLNPRLYPTSFSAGVDNIRRVLGETGYLRAYYVSVAYTVFTIAGVLLVSSMAAFEFVLFEFTGKRILFAIVMLSLMVLRTQKTKGQQHGYGIARRIQQTSEGKLSIK